MELALQGRGTLASNEKPCLPSETGLFSGDSSRLILEDEPGGQLDEPCVLAHGQVLAKVRTGDRRVHAFE